MTRPQSRLEFLLIQMASRTLLFRQHGSDSRIFAEEICPGSHLDKAICLPISFLYCAYSPHSADKGPRTEKSCTGVTNFYAMLKRSLNHCSQHSNEPPRHRFFCLAFAARLSDNSCVYYLTFTTPCTQDKRTNRQKPCVQSSWFVCPLVTQTFI